MQDTGDEDSSQQQLPEEQTTQPKQETAPAKEQAPASSGDGSDQQPVALSAPGDGSTVVTGGVVGIAATQAAPDLKPASAAEDQVCSPPESSHLLPGSPLQSLAPP